MTMPRPKGEALKIAKATIPGLNVNQRRACKKKRKPIPNDEVELKIVKINENRGKL